MSEQLYWIALMIAGTVTLVWLTWPKRQPEPVHKPQPKPAWTRDIEPRDEATDALYDTSSRGLMFRYGDRAKQQIRFAVLHSVDETIDKHINRVFWSARMAASCAFKVRPELDPRSQTPTWALLRAMEDARAIRHRQQREVELVCNVEDVTVEEVMRELGPQEPKIVWFAGRESTRLH